MYTVTIAKECGCFKRSDFQNNVTFSNKDEALIEATEWAKEMNDTFCKKHRFSVMEEGDNFVVAVEMGS